MQDNEQILQHRRRVLTLFNLVMITVGAVDSIRNLPITALFGSQIFVFLILATLFFLLPSALVSAELAARSSNNRGIYSWISEAMGAKAGFAAVWFQWIENVVYFPGLLTYIAATVGYMISPALAHNRIYLTCFVLIVFWAVTLLNLKGMRYSGWFSSMCSILGLFVPVTLIIIMGCVWVMSGKPIHINLHPHALLPNFKNWHIWITISGVMLSMQGIEIATAHTPETKNPQKIFPRALTIATILILLTVAFGATAIAAVIPHAKLSLVSGIMQYFNAFFTAYHMHWMLDILGISLVIGGLGGLSSWVIAPTRGLQIAGESGFLPKFLIRENRHFIPSNLLITQAIIVSLVALIFIFIPNVNTSYWIINVLATQLYMFMYLLMFLSGILLKKRGLSGHPTYQVPGKHWGMYLIASLGIIGSLVTIIIGLFPPHAIDVKHVFSYESFMLLGLIIMSAPILLAFSHYKKHKALHNTQ